MASRRIGARAARPGPACVRCRCTSGWARKAPEKRSDPFDARFVVRSPKTEHHADAGVRVVPMFPQLAGLFQAVFDQAESGSLHVITRYRNSSVNLRTQFLRLISRAGLKPWPKLWQNLRASRATELADAFPSHVCAAWLGHTERIADAFYRQVTDEHVARAIHTPPSAAQDPAQQEHAAGRTAQSVVSAKQTESLFLSEKRGSAITCEAQTLVGLGDTGLEQASVSSENRRSRQPRGTDSGTLLDPGLVLIIQRWPHLPQPLRDAMLAIVRSQP